LVIEEGSVIAGAQAIAGVFLIVREA